MPFRRAFRITDPSKHGISTTVATAVVAVVVMISSILAFRHLHQKYDDQNRQWMINSQWEVQKKDDIWEPNILSYVLCFIVLGLHRSLWHVLC